VLICLRAKKCIKQGLEVLTAVSVNNASVRFVVGRIMLFENKPDHVITGPYTPQDTAFQIYQDM
jgi:hypothetical protein